MSRAYAARHGWRWAGGYLRRGRVAAAFRQLIGAYIRGHAGEACQECGRAYFLWWAPDDVYGEATSRWPTPWRDGTNRAEAASGLFCPACFDRLARRKGIVLEWRPARFADGRNVDRTAER